MLVLSVCASVCVLQCVAVDYSVLRDRETKHWRIGCACVVGGERVLVLSVCVRECVCGSRVVTGRESACCRESERVLVLSVCVRVCVLQRVAVYYSVLRDKQK